MRRSSFAFIVSITLAVGACKDSTATRRLTPLLAPDDPPRPTVPAARAGGAATAEGPVATGAPTDTGAAYGGCDLPHPVASLLPGYSDGITDVFDTDRVSSEAGRPVYAAVLTRAAAAERSGRRQAALDILACDAASGWRNVYHHPFDLFGMDATLVDVCRCAFSDDPSERSQRVSLVWQYTTYGASGFTWAVEVFALDRDGVTTLFVDSAHNAGADVAETSISAGSAPVSASDVSANRMTVDEWDYRRDPLTGVIARHYTSREPPTPDR